MNEKKSTQGKVHGNTNTTALQLLEPRRNSEAAPTWAAIGILYRHTGYWQLKGWAPLPGQP